MVPLEKAPLYSPQAFYSRYWSAQRNATEWSVFMKELVLSGNKLTELMLQSLAPTLSGAHIGIFDSHALFSDIIARPKLYLNGTAPPNVDGVIQKCVFELDESTSDPGNCTEVQGAARDSYLWYVLLLDPSREVVCVNADCNL